MPQQSFTSLNPCGLRRHVLHVDSRSRTGYGEADDATTPSSYKVIVPLIGNIKQVRLLIAEIPGSGYQIDTPAIPTFNSGPVTIHETETTLAAALQTVIRALSDLTTVTASTFPLILALGEHILS
jgi:hypothetical protein